jgi:hypothetical protein
MARSALRAFVKFLAGVAVPLALAALPLRAAAQPAATEAAVKAAYLHRFLSYVEWPPSALPAPTSPFMIGVLGSDAVASALPAIVAGRQHAGRPIGVRMLPSGTASLDGLHVLFIGRSTAADSVMARLAQRPVLVVTENEIDAGGMLNFVVVDGRVRFEAAPAMAEQAGLKLSARLLAIAERVRAP